MTSRRILVLGALTVIVAGFAWLLLVTLPASYRRSRTPAAAVGTPATPAAPGRKIKAHLFYVADDGTRLTDLERDVAFGEGTVEQARQIIEAQIAPAVEPLVSAVPVGTRLRTLFVTEHGEAFVDFSGELVTGHSGGSTDEILTVYTIVDALTANLPAVTSVQLLVEGKQIETLAGHVDLSRPLAKNLSWVQ
ncbi:MAG: GerMN domain-containing protein [Acidobacteriota bacterium]